MMMMKLVDLIINQYEKNNNWNNVTDGNSSYRIEEIKILNLVKKLKVVH
jgi:hypothetical protein